MCISYDKVAICVFCIATHFMVSMSHSAWQLHILLVAQTKHLLTKTSYVWTLSHAVALTLTGNSLTHGRNQSFRSRVLLCLRTHITLRSPTLVSTSGSFPPWPQIAGSWSRGQTVDPTSLMTWRSRGHLRSLSRQLWWRPWLSLHNTGKQKLQILLCLPLNDLEEGNLDSRIVVAWRKLPTVIKPQKWVRVTAISTTSWSTTTGTHPSLAKKTKQAQNTVCDWATFLLLQILASKIKVGFLWDNLSPEPICAIVWGEQSVQLLQKTATLRKIMTLHSTWPTEHFCTDQFGREHHFSLHPSTIWETSHFSNWRTTPVTLQTRVNELDSQMTWK